LCRTKAAPDQSVGEVEDVAIEGYIVSDRVGFIGGSDIAPILGLSQYRTPVDVWLEKTGQAPPYTESKAARRGKFLENAILDWYEHDTGKILVRNIPPISLSNHLRMSLDALVEGERVVDAKSVSPYVAKQWGTIGTDEVPLAYACQMQWYMGGMNLPEADLAALIGDDLKVYTVRFDCELYGQILAAAERFWHDHVLTMTPPEPITVDDAKILWPKSNETAKEVGLDVATMVSQIAHHKDVMKYHEGVLSELETRVKIAFEDCDTLTYNGQKLATYRTQSASRFDQKKFTAEQPELAAGYRTTSTFRVLRIKNSGRSDD